MRKQNAAQTQMGIAIGKTALSSAMEYGTNRGGIVRLNAPIIVRLNVSVDIAGPPNPVVVMTYGNTMSDLVRDLKTDSNGYTICPACRGNKWKAVKNPRLGPGVYETRCEKCNGYGWIEQEHETRP